jgi:hypothetical protein
MELRQGREVRACAVTNSKQPIKDRDSTAVLVGAALFPLVKPFLQLKPSCQSHVWFRSRNTGPLRTQPQLRAPLLEPHRQLRDQGRQLKQRSDAKVRELLNSAFEFAPQALAELLDQRHS